MFDFGFDKLALIGLVALVVIGPERLPRVARTVGHLLGKAQRYVADVKAEVNRTIELEELQKIKGQFQDAAQHLEQSINDEVRQATSLSDDEAWAQTTPPFDSHHDNHAYAGCQRARKNWRVKRTAVPAWYKQRQGLRVKVQSGAARVARLRPVRRPTFTP